MGATHFMTDQPTNPGAMRRPIEGIGLARPQAGQSTRATSSALSRYGRFTSRRLDEDIDDLAERVAALEAELGPRRAG